MVVAILRVSRPAVTELVGPVIPITTKRGCDERQTQVLATAECRRFESGQPDVTSEQPTYPEPSQAVTVFVLGLLSLVLGFLAPFAWYMGNQELKAMDAGRRDPKDRSLAVAGRVLGMVLTILFIAFVVIAILFVLLVVAVGRTTSGVWTGFVPILP